MKQEAKLTALFRILRMRPICYAYDWLRMRQLKSDERRRRVEKLRKQTEKLAKTGKSKH